MATPFTDIRLEAGDVERSASWYMKTVRNIASGLNQPNEVFGSDLGEYTQRLDIGQMYAFKYNPKHKETLPYYDVFPLVIPIKKYTGGFLGINFHYLPIPLRLKLWEKFAPLTLEDRRIGWKKIAGWRYIKPCVKRYSAKAVRTKFVPVRDEAMNIAVYMPVQRFKKQKAPFKDQVVWKESRMLA